MYGLVRLVEWPDSAVHKLLFIEKLNSLKAPLGQQGLAGDSQSVPMPFTLVALRPRRGDCVGKPTVVRPVEPPKASPEPGAERGLLPPPGVLTPLPGRGVPSRGLS